MAKAAMELTTEMRTMKVKDVNPAPYNPRKKLKKGSKQYEALKRSIQTYGLVEPLVWNEDSGRLVGGHQRLYIVQDLGWQTVDVVVVHLTEQQERALNVALNKITGDWDKDTLAELLKSLDSDMVLLTGFEGRELERLLDTSVDAPEMVFTEELLESHNYVVVYFDNDLDWQVAKERLGLGTRHALDSREGYERPGIGRVVKGTDFLRLLK